MGNNQWGGGIYIRESTVTLESVVLSNNRAVDVSAGSNWNFHHVRRANHSHFSKIMLDQNTNNQTGNNQAGQGAGGGIYIYGSTVTLETVELQNNVADVSAESIEFSSCED